MLRVLTVMSALAAVSIASSSSADAASSGVTLELLTATLTSPTSASVALSIDDFCTVRASVDATSGVIADVTHIVPSDVIVDSVNTEENDKQLAKYLCSDEPAEEDDATTSMTTSSTSTTTTMSPSNASPTRCQAVSLTACNEPARRLNRVYAFPNVSVLVYESATCVLDIEQRVVAVLSASASIVVADFLVDDDGHGSSSRVGVLVVDLPASFGDDDGDASRSPAYATINAHALTKHAMQVALGNECPDAFLAQLGCEFRRGRQSVPASSLHS